MARTAVITKTATTVAGNSQRRQMAQAQEAAAAQAPVAAPAAPPPPPVAAAPAGTDDLIDQLGKLADLKAAGVLDDAEFAAAKARLLGT
ncbi:Short C-terminal domain-containing protein [Nocardioides alpinus]|uniref:Short C-terminal domain-containing protein n=1 Tax=Nocardioides alpinus TaxID=748909 RepID=A0A1I1AVS2_9ACTN|nr:SHOCT domain-containing protein [Nocardioides alpinus]PKH40935.1 hypothetical protein CXG46_10775 [Nocardioides alpinus]SFB42175.1 Short C-terminal domain-containing protein [Nocardioides alpinus]